jgi:hypothetical protein
MSQFRKSEQVWRKKSKRHQEIMRGAFSSREDEFEDNYYSCWEEFKMHRDEE